MNLRVFHLHFYCQELKLYEEFFTKELGFKIIGRFSVKGGVLPENYEWEQIQNNKIRIRLIELQKGGVNIVIMLGKFEIPKLEHFGFILPSNVFDETLIKARSAGLRVQERPNRTFISSNLGFRIGIHRNDEKAKAQEADFNELFISKIVFTSENIEEFLSLLDKLFGLKSEKNQIQKSYF